MGLETHPAKVSPVQEFAQTLSSVPLDDPLAPALLAELKQERSELVTRLVHPSKPPVQDVNTCRNKQQQLSIHLKINFGSHIVYKRLCMSNTPYAEGSAMCSSMKHPKPDRLVEIDGIPMTVHSADGDRNRRPPINILILYNTFVHINTPCQHA